MSDDVDRDLLDALKRSVGIHPAVVRELKVARFAAETNSETLTAADREWRDESARLHQQIGKLKADLAEKQRLLRALKTEIEDTVVRIVVTEHPLRTRHVTLEMIIEDDALIAHRRCREFGHDLDCEGHGR